MSDLIQSGFEEWLNEILFEHKGEGDTVVWIGNNRWLIIDNEGEPGRCFTIELHPAKVVRDV